MEAGRTVCRGSAFVVDDAVFRGALNMFQNIMLSDGDQQSPIWHVCAVRNLALTSHRTACSRINCIYASLAISAQPRKLIGNTIATFLPNWARGVAIPGTGALFARNALQTEDDQILSRHGSSIQSLVRFEHVDSGRIRCAPAPVGRPCGGILNVARSPRSWPWSPTLLFAFTMVTLNTVVGLVSAIPAAPSPRPPPAS
jgi:hypothetical protein